MSSLQREIAERQLPNKRPYMLRIGKQKARGDLSLGPVNSSDDANVQVFCPTSQM
jgi:hypothetical protein